VRSKELEVEHLIIGLNAPITPERRHIKPTIYLLTEAFVQYSRADMLERTPPAAAITQMISSMTNSLEGTNKPPPSALPEAARLQEAIWNKLLWWRGSLPRLAVDYISRYLVQVLREHLIKYGILFRTEMAMCCAWTGSAEFLREALELCRQYDEEGLRRLLDALKSGNAAHCSLLHLIAEPGGFPDMGLSRWKSQLWVDSNIIDVDWLSERDLQKINRSLGHLTDW
jgi:hypothetical protein